MKLKTLLLATVLASWNTFAEPIPEPIPEEIPVEKMELELDALLHEKDKEVKPVKYSYEDAKIELDKMLETLSERRH